MTYLSLIAGAALILTLSGCESIKARNVIKTGATTAVTYAVAGPIPALINLGTSIVVDEVLPEENVVADIEKGNKEQMFAFITDKFLIYALYGFIGFLVFTNILGPWAAQRRARRQMKYEQLEQELSNLKKD
jgi:hypothetical protein